MSILIKGMEMPKSCWGCYFQDCGNCVLNSHKVVDKFILEDSVDNECPLVEVPPHGRLIDADVLLGHMKKIHDKWKMKEHYTPTTDDEIIIINMPTIIEAEEGET